MIARFVVFIAIAVSMMIVQLTLPLFNSLTGKNISLETQNIGFIAAALLLTTIATGLIAGTGGFAFHRAACGRRP